MQTAKPRRLVLADWTATYADPVRIAGGEVLVLTGREEVWDGHRWLWARAPDGREGWVPDTLVRDGRALRDFDARELTCRAGEAVTWLHATHGWAWCRAGDGREGWVPERCLGA